MKDFKKIITAYTTFFTEKGFLDLVKKQGKRIGTKLIYTGLLLFYAYKRDETPYWAKNIVLGSLGYLISPIDFLPDLTPILGYTDDFGVLSFGLVAISSYVNQGVKEKAKSRMGKWFGSWDENSLAEIDNSL